MKINFKYKILIIALLILMLLSGVIIYLFLISKNKSEKEIREPCLADNEFADYYPRLPIPFKPVTISIKDKNTNKEKFSFQIENVLETYFTVQPRKCGVYVIRVFNYDPKKTKQDPGYREEIWKYTYDGKREPIILLSEKLEEFKLHYSSDFQIDPLERYVALIKGYLGSSDYAFVIKSLKTLEDMFVLSMREIEKQNAEIMGNISFEDWWTKDSHYFWGRTHMGAYTLGFFRIDTADWSVGIFEVPEGVLGGSALNIEKGYVTRHPGYIWIGIYEDAERTKKEWQEQGKISSLYLYNLFTKEQILLATTSEPLWFFEPKWISDTELEYYMPSGEKKIYNIKK
ncbi:MAG: hypothetical protein ACOZAL_03815 [Patescibacteria group bacterium]